MSEYTLTLVDVRQVQRYLFGANELKQNLGASEIVERATHQWLQEALPQPHNAPSPLLEKFDEAKTIEGGGLRAEVMFAGGGNVAVLFESEPEAKAFARRYTQSVLRHAPGLDVAVGHVPVGWDNGGALAGAWEKMTGEVMPQRKDGRVAPQPIAGLGVTAQCAFTGQPAVAEYREADGPRGVLISAEVEAKLDYAGWANDRLNRLLSVQGFEYPRDFERLGGERGRANYIAVVHADGNGMGQRLAEFARGALGNRETVHRLRRFSQSLNRRGLTAMEAVRDLLALNATEEGSKLQIRDALGKDETVGLHGTFLPLRPIVFGGDDATFVCDGRLGLALAAKYLEAFDDEPLADGAPGYACAGVAVVHTHFPFAQAYALAEALCQDAKREARILTGHNGHKSGVSLLQWHYAISGLLASWEEVRRHEYTVQNDGDLILRPLTVAASGDVGFSRSRSWEAFLGMAREFRGDRWTRRRNKVKALRSALRAGPAATREFTSLHGALPPVAGLLGNSEVTYEGWYGGRCVYFDALEADDLFIFLE